MRRARSTRPTRRTAQAWITPLGEDPEAVSALAVARARLPEARGLEGLERRRLIELAGSLPPRTKLAARIEASTQFYNPNKERCVLRTATRDRAPVETGDIVVLVWEDGGARRPAAERWWKHETGHAIEVVEATAWVLRFARGHDAAEGARALAEVRSRRSGLLANPLAQRTAIAASSIPIAWLGTELTGRRSR